ncbi:MAG: AAA family ATPase [Candidatus Aenigmarchaeota archaeon]|nr:AAA family ATPase [Candidatus Aenigmarchaeota archaeon]
MSIFQNIQESKIYKNEQALSTEFLPNFLPHRETQIQEIARNLNPLTKGRKPQNTFISGPPGIGKTCVTRFVFRELDEYAGEKVDTVFVNTWDYNTAPALLTKIVIELGYPIPRRGLSKDEIVEKLIEILKRKGKSVVIGLDEIDQLVNKDGTALYDLLRINQYVKTPVGLVMISNYSNIFSNIEPRIKSSLDTQEIGFKGYSLQEMKDILKERCNEAFRTGSVQEGVLLLCGNHAVNRGGDVRVGLECLRKAAKICEKEDNDRILVKHVKEILPSVKKVKLQIMRDRLEGVDKNIVEILKNEKKMVFSDFEEKYNQKHESLSHTSLKKHLDYLEGAGLIRTSETRSGSRGRKSYISLVKRKNF